MAAAGARLIMLPQGSCPLSHRRKIFFQILQQLFRLAIQIQKFQPQIIPDKRICRRNIRAAIRSPVRPKLLHKRLPQFRVYPLIRSAHEKRVILADLGYIPGVFKTMCCPPFIVGKEQAIKGAAVSSPAAFGIFPEARNRRTVFLRSAAFWHTAYWSGN